MFSNEYITAFGLVTYNVDKDEFSMKKPLAFITGGIGSLMTHLRERCKRSLSNVMKWGAVLIVAGFTLGLSIAFM